MGKLTEEDKLMRRIEKRFNKGVVQYGLKKMVIRYW